MDVTKRGNGDGRWMNRLSIVSSGGWLWYYRSQTLGFTGYTMRYNVGYLRTLILQGLIVLSEVERQS
jgi:hypothetical protein